MKSEPVERGQAKQRGGAKADETGDEERRAPRGRAAKTSRLDRELAHLAPEARWVVWTARVEAVLFASRSPVGRAALARVIGQDVVVDAVVADLAARYALGGVEVVRAAGGWAVRTRAEHVAVVEAAANLGPREAPALNEADALALAAIAFHQPLTRADLSEVVGREVSAERIAKLRRLDLVGQGPRNPSPGAPATLVTTAHFLDTFGLDTLDDLPMRDELEDAGLIDPPDVSDDSSSVRPD